MPYYEEGEPIHCPVCGEQFTDSGWCKHLVISADDSELVNTTLQFAEAEPLWQKLRAEAGDDCACDSSSFVAKFVEPCPAAARVDEQPWGGGGPGLSGIWTFAWTSDPQALKSQIRDHLLDELNRIRSAKSPPPKPPAQTNCFARLAREFAAERSASKPGAPATRSPRPTSLAGASQNPAPPAKPRRARKPR